MKYLSIISLIIITKICFSQDLELIAHIDINERKYLEYLREDNVVSSSFVIDSNKIYMANQKLFEKRSTYLWEYKLPFSKTNPKIIEKFKGQMLKRVIII